MKFKPGDFKSIIQDAVFYDTANDAARDIAALVNAQIKRWLDGAPTVYKAAGYGHYDTWVENLNELDSYPSHAGKLVCVEKLGRIRFEEIKETKDD